MNTRRLFGFVCALVILAGLLAACQPIEPQGGQGMLLKSDKARNVEIAFEQADVDALVGGNNAFAFDLYQQLRSQDGNMIYSPFSISLAMAMVYGGARGGTAEQMASTLHFPFTDQKLHSGYNWLDLELEKRALGSEGKKNSGFELSIANSIWGQQGYDFQQTFLDLLAENYGAGLRSTDFVNESEASRKAINEWVSDETKDKIQDLLPEGSVNPNTRLVLANAIYFFAPWLDEFDKNNTSAREFTLIDGNKVNVDMMYAKHRYGYLFGPGYQAVEIPYRGDQVAFLAIMPDEGNFANFEEDLSADKMKEIRAQIQYGDVKLTMPKFKFESKFGLNDTLRALGISDAFDDGAADFSGIDGRKDLVITDVVHKAYIDVNEKGTEAAAATGIVVGVTSMREENVITLDHPFIFAIFDKVTGSILFLGRVTNPAQ